MKSIVNTVFKYRVISDSPVEFFLLLVGDTDTELTYLVLKDFKKWSNEASSI